MTLITMSAKEIDRFAVIGNLVEEKIIGLEAAEQLHLTPRQVWRLKKRFDKDNPQTLVHGGRGKNGNRKHPMGDKILKLLKTDYAGFGPTLAAEKLLERNEIKVSDETIRSIMVKNELWKAKALKKNKEHREWRPRRDQFGSLVQYDGCYHIWFGSEECCLLLAVDDATGKIVRAWFDYHEGILPTFNFWKGYVEEKGKPIAIYLDRFSTYKINHKAAEDNKELKTQFQRVCDTLGVTLIFANSPEAKGRVERMFETLQDRLVKELKLEKIKDIDAANQFLKDKFIPAFNKRFAVVPTKQGDQHRELNKLDQEHLHSIFSIHSQRVVMNDFTLQFKNQYFQLNEVQPMTVCRKDKVLVEEHLDGSVHLKLRGKELNYTVLPKRPEKEFKLKIPALTTSKSSYIPPADHPWRKRTFTDKMKFKTT